MIKRYLIDLDGTLYAGGHSLPYAGQFINHLNRTNTPYLLTTNCPLHSPASLVRRLGAMGIDTAEEHVLTSGMACADYLREQGISDSIYIEGSADYRQWMISQGFALSTSNASVAIVGYNPEMTYGDLRDVCREIMNGALFLLTNGDHVIPREGALVPHTGAIGAAVSYATKVDPVVIGKPNAAMLRSACTRLGCDAASCVVIGDRMDTDIAFAKRHGATAFLVLTGVTRREDVSGSNQPDEQPDRIFETLQELFQAEWGGCLC